MRVAPGFQLFALTRCGWNDSERCAWEERALRADRIPACAGNAGQEARFRYRCFNLNGVILGLVPRILVEGFEGMVCWSPLVFQPGFSGCASLTRE